jgi:hypothetical protein
MRSRPHRVYRAELDWRDCQYGDSGFALELVEKLGTVRQMIRRVDLESGKGLGRVRRTEQCKARRGRRKVVSGPVPDAPEAGLAEDRHPQLG